MIRQVAVLAALGLAGLVLQGALAALLPAPLLPDFSLLVTVAAAVTAPPLLALAAAAGLGYGADLLSGTLLGEQALLRLLAFAATRLVSGQFHLERGIPLASFCFALGLLDAAGLAGLSQAFLGSSPIGLDAIPGVVLRALVLALLAAPIHHLIETALAAVGEGESRRREVRFDTRRPVL